MPHACAVYRPKHNGSIVKNSWLNETFLRIITSSGVHFAVDIAPYLLCEKLKVLNESTNNDINRYNLLKEIIKAKGSY